MVKKQLKDSARPAKRHIERRPAGQPATADATSDVKLRYPVPQPRPIPRDHPARDIFRKENLNDNTNLESNAQLFEVSSESVAGSTSPAAAIGIPTSIPNAIPTGIPIETNKVDQLASRGNHEPQPTTPKSNSSTASVRKKAPQHTWASADAINTRPVKSSEGIDELTQATTPLDATHTASEKIIYSIMYRETISRQVRERHFGPAELMKKSGIRSRNTVHQAIYGLTRKLSIEVVSKQQGNSLGPRYRVYRPQEVEERRRRAGIFIDEQTKKITDAEQVLSSAVEDEQEDQFAIPGGIPTGIPISDLLSQNLGGGYPKIWEGGIPKFGIVLNSKDKSYDSSGALASSSSKSPADNHEDDDEKLLDFVRDCYVETTGNEWTTADAAAVLRAPDIRAEIWGIAICYCVDRAPDHKFSRLAYVVEEARRHQEEMRGFSITDLRAILGHSRRLIERARSSGAWQRRDLDDPAQTT